MHWRDEYFFLRQVSQKTFRKEFEISSVKTHNLNSLNMRCSFSLKTFSKFGKALIKPFVIWIQLNERRVLAPLPALCHVDVQVSRN